MHGPIYLILHEYFMGEEIYLAKLDYRTIDLMMNIKWMEDSCDLACSTVSKGPRPSMGLLLLNGIWEFSLYGIIIFPRDIVVLVSL